MSMNQTCTGTSRALQVAFAFLSNCAAVSYSACAPGRSQHCHYSQSPNGGRSVGHGRSVGPSRSAPGRRARGRRAFRDSRGDPPDSDGPTRSPHSEPTTRVRVAVFNLKVFRTPRPGLRFDGSRRNSARCPRTAPRPANSPRRRGACQWQCQWQWPSQWGSGFHFHAGYSVWQLRESPFTVLLV